MASIPSLSELFTPAPPGITSSGVAPPTSNFYTLTGDVAVTNGLPNVVGSGTEFTAQLEVGQVVQFSEQVGVDYTILAIGSDTALTLSTNYSGTSSIQTSIQAQSQSWLQTILADGATLNLPTTAWQPGQVVRTIFAICAVEFSKMDSIQAQQASGGFLDFAATGTITFTDIDGNTVIMPVSPDPSIPGQNPNAALTWLDVLASSVYNVSRVAAASAQNPIWLVNTTGSSFGTFPAGTFHAANTLTGATFTAQAPFTFSPSATAGTTISAVSYGATVQITTSAAHGLSSGTVVFIAGVPGLGGSGLINPNASASGVGGGFASITVTGANTFTLNGVTGAGTYASGGLVYLPQSVEFAADLVGSSGNSAIGQIITPINSIPGGAIGNLVTFAGTNYQSNVSVAAQCRAKLATLSPNGPSGAYQFYALAASLILSGQPVVTGGPVLPNPLPANVSLDGGAITRATVQQNLATGTVQVTVANATGPVDGCVGLAITAVAAGSPVVVTAAGHGMQTGDWCQINGVQGMTGVNGTWQVIVLSSSTFSLNGSTGAGAYTGSGFVSGGDLFAVNAVVNAFTTPNAVTEKTQSAASVTVTPTATVYVPNALTGDYASKMTAALTAYFASFPIGGYNVDNANNVLPISAIEGLLFAAGQQSGSIYTVSVNGLQLNGQGSDIGVGSTGIAALGSLSGIQIVGI
jgi:hypothetical protein